MKIRLNLTKRNGGDIIGKGCSPSGGIYPAIGRIGSLQANGEPNSRTDLYDDNGELIQSRWYDEEGWAIRNRDYRHGFKYAQVSA